MDFPSQAKTGGFATHPFEGSPLSDVTPHVLRHSFASIANDLSFAEVIAATGSKAGAGELTWSGRIAYTIFRGPIRSIVVQTDDGPLNVDAPPFGNYAIDDNVTVMVSQRAAWAVTESVRSG